MNTKLTKEPKPTSDVYTYRFLRETKGTWVLEHHYGGLVFSIYLPKAAFPEKVTEADVTVRT